MSNFEETAARIFEAAECASQAGESLSEFSILVGEAGGISMVVDPGWSLESLQAERGARMAYRVSHGKDTVKVEGRAGTRTCLFEAKKTDGVARFLLAHPAEYSVSDLPATPSLLPARTWLTLPEASD